MGYDPWAYLEDSMAKQVDWATAPIVCGGIYNKDTGRTLADGTPIVTWGVMGPAEMGRDGKMQGYMTGFDTPPFLTPRALSCSRAGTWWLVRPC